MPNRYRKQAVYTIDETVLKDFNDLSKNLSINKSRLVEKLIKNWIVQVRQQPISGKLSVDNNKLIVEN